MSYRKARRNLHKWFRYFRKYEPWHLSTPGLEKAYNRMVHASYANIRNRKESGRG